MKVAILTFLLVSPPLAATAQAVQPGSWDVTSKIVDLTVPGLPGLIARMARGRSKSEHKRLAAGQGMEALLAPDPKAQCRIEGQRIVDGRFDQTLTCPQKSGGPLHIARAGTYDGAGFTGSATVAGMTPKGPMRIALDQHAVRVGS